MVMIQALISGMNLFSLLALPLFLLAGEIMNRSGITEDLLDFSDLIVGRIRGGLAHVNIMASIIFAGISGAAVADASALGTTLIPMMRRKGYGTDFSVAVTASSSTIGPIIPPSIIMVLVGISANQSIGALFLGGVIPGLMMGIGLMIVSYIISVKRNYPIQPAKSFKNFFRIFFRSLPALLVPLIIIGGIAFGVFAPTEAAAVAYCMVYWVSKSLWISRGCCTMESLADCIFASAKTSASILWIVGAARGVSWILAKEGVASLIYEYILLLNLSPVLFIFIINILLIVVGCLMETSAALFIFVPIILPLAAIVGFDQFHMASIIGMNLAIGLTTQPIGLSLYVSANIGKISLGNASKAVLPFVGIQIVVLFIVSYFPVLVTWLPRLAGLLE